MAAFLVFNDLSTEHGSHLGATDCFENFAGVLLDERIKGKKILVTPAHFLQLQVSPGYSIGRLLKEIKLNNSDRRLLLKTLIDKRSTYSNSLPSDDLTTEDIEYRFLGRPAQGLFVALRLDGLSISFLSRNRWDCTSLQLEKWWITDDTVESRTFDVPHASRATHLDAHTGWLQRNHPELPSSGNKLWDERALLFPNLDFCPSVEYQICGLSAGDLRFKAILRGLQDLQNYCASWTEPNFDIHRLSGASGESQSTLKMYSADRIFLCPDGEYRLFEWHLKRSGNRIHFLDFPEQKRILVGYVGAHLPISSQ